MRIRVIAQPQAEFDAWVAQLRAAAPLYETEPVDCPPGTQSFFNTVIEITADLEPLALLHHMRRIEAELP